MASPWALTPKYVRNRLLAASVAALEAIASRKPRYEEAASNAGLRAPFLWDPPATIGQPVESEEMPGLFLVRGAVDREGVAALRALVDGVIRPARSRGIHGEAEAAAREAEVLLRQSALLPRGTRRLVQP